MLDPRTALVVVDLQKGVVSLPTAHPVDGVVKNAGVLADAFREKGLPVVLVTAAGVAPGRVEVRFARREMGADWADLVPELHRVEGDHLVVKRTWGAFTGTGLDGFLRGEGVTQVVVCGIATTMGVESTARAAQECGYNVTLAVDAMTDVSVEAHENSVERIFPRLGETGSTAEILALL